MHNFTPTQFIFQYCPEKKAVTNTDLQSYLCSTWYSWKLTNSVSEVLIVLAPFIRRVCHLSNYSVCVVALPSSRVEVLIPWLYGPGPWIENALTRMKYSVYSSSPVRFTMSTDESVMTVLEISVLLNSVWLYSTSYAMMIPFRSSSETSPHITSNTDEEVLTALTFCGGPVGTVCEHE